MQITLKEIKTFTKCPKYYWFAREVLTKPTPMDLSIATSLIKKAYTVATETGFKANWRRVLGWVNTAVMKDVDVMDAEQYEAARQLAEHIIKFVQSWYYDIYINEHASVYTDISLSTTVSTHLVQTTLPIIRIKEIPIVTVIGNKELSDRQLMNDIEVCGQMAILAKELDCDTIAYEYLCMGAYGGFNSNVIVRNNQQHDKCMKMLYYLSKSIEADIEYPSVTKMCETCLFKRRCKI